MKLTRPAFAHHSFRWPPRARRDICGCGGRAMGFMPEKRFGAGGKRGFRWFQSQAGLAVQPMFGLGFRLRWLGAAMDRLSVFGHGLAAKGARFVCIGARFVRIGARFDRIRVRFDRIGARFARIFVLLSMNLGESARIGKFGERNHRVFRHFLCLPIPIIILTAAPGAVILHLSSTGL